MTRAQPFILLALLSLLALGCREFDPDEKYQRPEWLAGKVYTQVKDQPELSTFARCIELAGYDSVLDISGSYTVFAPNNEAFSSYFQGHPVYSSIEDIPISDLTRFVKYHIVQNPWSKQQLRSLDVYGWIDTLDLTNNEPRGYKRETLLLEKNWNFGISSNEDGEMIITDTLESNWHRKVATDSRKYAPIFFKEYFDIYNLNSTDYGFYFDRTIESANDMFFAGGKIIGDEIFAENGFVYNIDRVNEPLLNAFQILNSSTRNYSYKDFLNLLYLFPEFTYNQEKTLDQPGADLGYEVDSLFDLTFPELAFDIHNERTQPPSGITGLPNNVSIRYHHGLLAPTNEAFANFIHDYLEQGDGIPWGSLENTPDHIKRIIANTYLSVEPVYPTNYESGFYNGELDIVRLDEADIAEKQYASNCTFIGLENAIVPRAFKSVTGPVYLQRGYSFSMFAIERTGLLSALKRENENYMLFVESDLDCRLDSSFFYSSFNERFFLYQISEGAALQIPLGTNDLRTLLLNHIGTDSPRGLARKEFIPNRTGNYLIVDNQTGEIKGTAPTTLGYRGSQVMTDIPEQLSTETDNGTTYAIDNWFSFSSTSLYNIISLNHPGFHNLLRLAELSQEQLSRYNFISDNEFYTVFAPTDSVLNIVQADTLPIADLKQFCLMHFIQGEMIFTDGNKSPGYYETLRIDESSTGFITVFSQVYIEPGIDVIHLPDKAGADYLSIDESLLTNRIAGINLGIGNEIFPNTVNNAVVHSIDRAFMHELMDTK
ncbi:MAG: fasciclin domain-containing protein [Bacteroidales bacterium]|nr:fasciclin domain-containing protein [Bacteroidales bacterium]